MKLSRLKYPLFVSLSLLSVLAVYFNAANIGLSGESYQLSTVPVKICGGTFYELKAESSANILVEYQTVALPKTGEKMLVPNHLVDLRLNKNQSLNVSGSAQIALGVNQKLLPFPRPLSNNARVIDDYCRQVKRFHSRLANSSGITISTSLLQMNLTAGQVIGSAKVVSLSAVNAPYQQRTSNTSQPVSLNPIKHVVIYDPMYASEALALSTYRTSKGVKSVAISVDTLPGYNPKDAVPVDCQGAYYKECYLDLSGIDNVDAATAQSMIGMRTGRNVGDPMPAKVVDVAGIIRAGLRKLKRDYPELSYVVLMGHPNVLPPRFTNTDDYESTYGFDGNFTLPTDLYFSEIDIPWGLTPKLSNSSISNLIYANGTTDGAGNTDWDTTHFIWPITSPRGRAMAFPNYYSNMNETVRSHMLAVGRLLAKAPVGIKDQTIGQFINKLSFYESHLPALNNNITATADGVYEYSHFNGVNNALGIASFWSERFGTGFVPAAQASSYPATCTTSNSPTVNNWTGMQGKGMYSFQNGPSECKPNDPSVAGHKLPNPNEIRTRINNSGYAFLFFEGHGGEVGIGLNTNSEWGAVGRALISPIVMNTTPGVDLHVNTMSSTYGQGFVVASSCSVGPFLGKRYGPYQWDSLKTLAESLVTPSGYYGMTKVGPVGAYMNYSVGWFGSDPAHEMILVNKVKEVYNNGTNRIGDAIKAIVTNHLNSVSSPNWAMTNRFYYGDPATLIARKLIVEPDNNYSEK